MARPPVDAGTPSARKIAMACLVGTAIEWYDFFIYATAAALVFRELFFPSFSPLAGTLAAFSTLAVGLLARPVGGVVMAHFGDRIGRKSALVASLLIMGFATVGIGLLPSYDQIGVLAPILLVVLRFGQGLGVGGEWGGAVLMAVEHAPPGKRGFYGSFPQMGVPIGLILSSLVFLVVSTAIPAAQFQAWGWRLPFLLSAVLVAVGLYVRLRITESPLFTDVKRTGSEARAPVREVLRNQPKHVLLAAGSFIANNTVGYIFFVYTLSYGTSALGLSRPQVLSVVIAGAAVWLVSQPWFSTLSDRIGRRKVLLGGAVTMTLWSAVYFTLLDTGSVALILLAVVVMALGLSATYGPQAAMFSELFATRVRYSGVSMGYTLGAILGGGVAPFVAAWLYGATGTSQAITLYMLAVCLVSVASVLAIGETSTRDLAEERAPAP